MHLKLLLPNQVFLDQTDVSEIIFETKQGAFGLLPHRRDCVAPLTPGILTFSTREGIEVFVAVDEGVLVKTGLEVLISVRSAIVGQDLSLLRKTVQQDFLRKSEQAQQVSAVMAKLESSFLHRFAKFQEG
ncbi:F0F1 ATP synthase subunit epsilon [Alteromonas facilis]|uniref:F0F1 ATP synthase subunit epsilon n=1 Tax=Alteromonas facilis TaxID=2048004 RepID=UPI000C28F72F|nr:F0F1 ATP synthase subunit epsilon [Alteromonas facilis]